jgi:hypothetical protein
MGSRIPPVKLCSTAAVAYWTTAVGGLHPIIPEVTKTQQGVCTFELTADNPAQLCFWPSSSRPTMCNSL